MRPNVAPKLSPEEYSELRSEVARRVNKARGISDATKAEVLRLYFELNLTARQVAEELDITHGAVRSTISRAYATMSLDERRLHGKHGGKWLGGDK